MFGSKEWQMALEEGFARVCKEDTRIIFFQEKKIKIEGIYYFVISLSSQSKLFFSIYPICRGTGGLNLFCGGLKKKKILRKWLRSDSRN
jgi:hypothetical protein